MFWKSMSIPRQIALLATVFAITLPVAVFAVAAVLARDAERSRARATEGDSKTDALFTLVRRVSEYQGTGQRLVRERDPDGIEALLEQGRAAYGKAQEAVGRAGMTGGAINQHLESLHGALGRSSQAVLLGDQAQALRTLVQECNPAFERLLDAIGVQQVADHKKEAGELTEIAASSRRTRAGVLAVIAVVLALLVAFAFAVVRNLTASLRRAVEELSTVAKDSAAAAAEVSASAQSLAQGTSEQAASLQKTAASSEQISSMTGRNAEHSKVAAEKMELAARQITDTNQRLQQMVASMSEISASGDKVSRIIRTIDEIAFQTNILALNAAVEAARAGDAGMGFAVVADEVRGLAQRSAEAARSTTALIGESVSKTREGKTRLDQMEESIRYLTTSASEARSLMEEIRAISEEQARGVSEIGNALTQMEKVTEANAAAAEQGASAGEELSSQARSIAATVGRLAALVDAGAGAQSR
jgi:methyl-accepting chemotaxis protein